MIYFIKANDKIKIGYATNPSKRIPQIQTSCPYDLEILLIIGGEYEEEQKLHKLFKEYRTNGEWFNFEDPIKNFIKENYKNDRRYEFGFINDDFNSNEQILRIRKENKWTLGDLGDKMSVSAQSISSIEKREKSGGSTIKKMKEIAEAIGYKFEYRFMKT